MSAPKAIGYVRVSTEGQATEGVSLDAQRAKIASWCSANGLALAAVHVDAGLSGGRADNRPGLQSALDEVCRPGGVLVVYSLSRLARSVRDTITIAERLDRAGADLASLSEKIDTTTAAGKMVFRLLSVLAEFERDLISERTTSAMAYKRGKGERVGTIPLGSRLDADGRTLLDDPCEQLAIATIRELAASGLGQRAIARELDLRGIATKTGRSCWSHAAVSKVLARPPAPSSLTPPTVSTPETVAPSPALGGSIQSSPSAWIAHLPATSPAVPLPHVHAPKELHHACDENP